MFKPMLASPVDWDTCTWPKAISPKLDGIRCVVMNGAALSRSLKPIPNLFIQSELSRYEGYDGEILIGDPTDQNVFRNTTGAVRSRDGEPDFRFYVFDKFDAEGGWSARFAYVNDTHGRIVLHEHRVVFSEAEAKEVTNEYLAMGYEGAMLRDPHGPYKHGRATTREQYLLKVKEWESREMIIEGMTERMHNTNEAKVNALGRTERSSAKDGKVGLDTMGTIFGRDCETGAPVEVGTGFSDDERKWFWKGGAIGLIARYRCMAYSGGYDAPRMAVFEGLRDREDMS